MARRRIGFPSIHYLVVACISLIASAAQAQISYVTTSTATPLPGVGHDYIGMFSETVSPASGSVSVRIEVPVPKGRGLTLPFAFLYNSSGVHHPEAGPNGTATWYSDTGQSTGSGWTHSLPTLTAFEGVTSLYNPGPPPVTYTCYFHTSYILQDPGGSRHLLPISTAEDHTGQGSGCSMVTNPPSNILAAGFDGFGAVTTAPCHGCSSFPPPPVTIAYKDGTVYSFSSFSITGNNGVSAVLSYPSSVKDSNGDTVSISNSGGTVTMTDTAGRTAIRVSPVVSNTSTVTVSGLSSPYTEHWMTYSSNFSTPQVAVGNFPCSGGISANTQGTTAVQSLTLPNNKSYQFQYNPTYGLLKQITYPSGGFVRYTWGVNPLSEFFSIPTPSGDCWYHYGVPAITRREVSFDGVNIVQQQDFSYTTTWDPVNVFNWTSKQTTVTTLDKSRNLSSTSIYTYVPLAGPTGPNSGSYPSQIPGESSVITKAWGGTTLRTVTKTWDSPTLLKSEQVTLDGVMTSQANYDNTGGRLIKKDEFHQGALTRTTTIGYASFGITPGYGLQAIWDRPSSVIVKDGAGNPVAETDYGYDQTAVGSVSATGHDDTNYGTGFNTRGNLTTKTQKCFGCTDAVTKYTYDVTGQVLTMIDPCGNATCADMTDPAHTTTYSYADSYTSGTPPGNTNAYLTKITRPATSVNHISNFSYGYADGQLTIAKDENGQSTTYSYVDSLGRLTSTGYPDGGQTTLSYVDTAPTSVTQNTLITNSPSLTLSKKTVMDGLGQAIQTQLTTDPEGTDLTDTTYDGLGRVWTRLNPHRAGTSSTDGTTTYTYDSLGRVTQVLEPDGSSITTGYVGNCTTVTDEAGKTRKSCSDGLGRLTQLFESPTTLNYETDYQYDALDDLKRVDQKGGDANSANWRTRLFNYDSLSRLTSASNPESGTTTYNYDNNGNLFSKVAPQPNQTGTLTVTTDYIYDALNRLTQKSYVGMSTPLVKYGYDGAALSGCTNVPPTLADTYPIGRRTAMCDGSGAASWNHDQMGRSLTEQRKIIGSSAVTKSISYMYNQDGSVAKITYPSTKAVTYTYNGAGRATQAVDVASNINYVTGATYTPPGGLLTYKNGVTGTFAGITVTDGYNNRLQPTLISAATPTTTLFSLGYGYGPANQNNGNPSTVVNNLIGASGRSQTFTYDALNRISTAQSQATSGTACWGQSFGVDPWGNLQTITATKCSPPILNAAADNHNHMIGFNYDAAGNLTMEGSGTPSWNYSWDAENRLSSISGSAADTFTYDGDGERVKKSNGALFWRQHGGPFLTKTGLTGTVIVERVYFNGLHVAAAHPPSGPVNYLFQDHLGGEHIVTNATGGVCWDSDTLPFGSEAGFTTSCNSSYRFADMERDDENSAQLDYAGARYYDLRLGRFLSVDPTRLSAFIDDPQTWNRYSYAHNNPLQYVDRNGKWPTKIHNEIINEAFQNLTEGQQQILKDVSAQQDSILGGGQANSLSFEHAMRGPGQTVEQAEGQYNDFVSGTEEAAQNAQVQFWLNNPDSTELSDEALARFAMVLHAVVDSTSPAHAGFQLWDWRNPSLVWRHHRAEKTITPQQRQAAVSAAQNAFSNTFGIFGSAFFQISKSKPKEHVTHKICINKVCD